MAVERRNGRVRADFGRSQLRRALSRVLAKWHEGGVGEWRQDPTAMARRVMIELPTIFLKKDDEMNYLF